MTAYNGYTDQELTVLLRAGNSIAFTEVFNRYHAPLYSHAYNKLRDEDDAHDVVQEMFTKLWLKRADLNTDNNLIGYLFKGVRNAVLDLIKHKKIVTAYEESFNGFVASNYAMTDYLIREKQFAELIEREIAALPSRMREVFELRRKENLSNKQIALRMNIAESTVADQMKKALKVLKMRIGLALILVSWQDVPTQAMENNKECIFFLAPYPQSFFLNRNVYSCRLKAAYYDTEKTTSSVN